MLLLSLRGIFVLSAFFQAGLSWKRDSVADQALSVGYVIFEGFEPLDVYGPLEILYRLSFIYNVTLSTISFNKGPVNARPPILAGNPPDGVRGDRSGVFSVSTVATHTFYDAPKLDVLIVPGGGGLDVLVQDNNTAIETFVAQRFLETDYVMSVCTGSAMLARAGVLSGKRATTNKAAWSGVTDPENGSNITWVPSARWVQDGKVWTSSGVAAGMDMMYAFVKFLYGSSPEGLASVNGVMNVIEYAPHTDPHWDPFSVVHKVPGADTNRSLTDCTAPVGYEDA